MTVESTSYHDDLRGKVRALLIMVADQLPPTTVELVTEMIDANESGVALETISEMLVESRGAVTSNALAVVDDLVRTMRFDPVNVDRLRPLASRNEGTDPS
jgi:hypothetical protein